MIGKRIGNYIYIHVAYINTLPQYLYNRVIRHMPVQHNMWNIVKVSKDKNISYLSYPYFNKKAHPKLKCSTTYTEKGNYIFREYKYNPPILHRKELFVGPEYIGRKQFEALTLLEESYGLFDNTSIIGHSEQWKALLAEKKLKIVRHRIVKI